MDKEKLKQFIKTDLENRDDHTRTIVSSVACFSCRHLDRTTKPRLVKCAAFPMGIPQNIKDGTIGHLKPVEGDHGIQYAPLREELDANKDS